MNVAGGLNMMRGLIVGDDPKHSHGFLSNESLKSPRMPDKEGIVPPLGIDALRPKAKDGWVRVLRLLETQEILMCPIPKIWWIRPDPI